MRICPTCAASYPSGLTFCPRDGTPLPETPAPVLTSPTDPLIGRVIAGRYQLLAFLGGGTMGVVYRASHNVLEREFAVKLLRREFCEDEKTLRRFFREAKVASLVDHDNIVRIHDFGQTEDQDPYLVMEYVTGITLFKLITESPGAHLPLSRALDIMHQVARALAHAHARGVIHRDVKPENIVLTREGEREDFVKILDFGVAKILGQQAISAAGEVLGTPEFLAPEGLLGTEVGAPADLYALGAMLHDAIIGSPPFSGGLRDLLHQHLAATPKLLSERRPELRVPPALDQLTQRLLAKDPKARPTGEEAAAQLTQIRATLNERPDRIDPTRTVMMMRGGDASLQLPARLLSKMDPAPPDAPPSVIVSQSLQLPQPRPGDSRPPAAPSPPPAPPAFSVDQRARAMMPTVVSSGDPEARAAQRSRLGQQAQEVAEALARRLPAPPPERLAHLRREISEHEEAEVEVGTQLALTDEKLRGAGASGEPTLKSEQVRLKQQMHEARDQVLRLRRDLAAAVLAHPDSRSPASEAERRALELLLAELDGGP